MLCYFGDRLLRCRDADYKVLTQKANFPSLTNREVGALLVKIDPQLAATMNISGPENIYKKVHRICLRNKG